MNFQEKLNRFDLKTVSVAELEDFFAKEILGHSRPTMKLWFEKLFRVRNVTSTKIEELNTTSSIWYPDWSMIENKYHSFNRCSDMGQNFFYCSNVLEATIKEIDPAHDDLLLIGIFDFKFPRTPAQSQFAGIEHLKKSGRYKLLDKHIYNTEEDKNVELIVSEIFRKKTPANKKFQYKLSIAFSNILLKNDEINCLVYPSVASNLEFENYGLKPDFVDNHMFCEQIYLYRVSISESKILLTAEKYGTIEQNKLIPKLSSIIWKDNYLEKDKSQLQYYIKNKSIIT